MIERERKKAMEKVSDGGKRERWEIDSKSDGKSKGNKESVEKCSG